MIKLNRLPSPVVLRDNCTAWTKNLMALVDKYGGYNKIPAKEKEPALRFYRHEDIKQTLKASTHGKCAFCEGIPDETGYSEVEHFYPKSLYTEKHLNGKICSTPAKQVIIKNSIMIHIICLLLIRMITILMNTSFIMIS